MAVNESIFNISGKDDYVNKVIYDKDYSEKAAEESYEAEFTWHDSPEMRTNLEISCEHIEEYLNYPDCDKDIAKYKEAVPQSFYKAAEMIYEMAHKQNGHDHIYTSDALLYDLQGELDDLMDLNKLEYLRDEIVIPKTSKENAEIAFEAFKFCSPENGKLQDLKELVTEKDVTYKEFHDLYIGIKNWDAYNKPDIDVYIDASNELDGIFDKMMGCKETIMYDQDATPEEKKEAKMQFSDLAKEYDQTMDKAIEAARNIHNEWDANHLCGFQYSKEAFELEFVDKNYSHFESMSLEEALNKIQDPGDVLLGINNGILPVAKEELDIAADFTCFDDNPRHGDGRFLAGEQMEDRMNYDLDKLAGTIERAPIIKIAHQLEEMAHKGDWEQLKDEFAKYPEEKKEEIFASIQHDFYRKQEYCNRLLSPIDLDWADTQEVMEYFEDHPGTNIEKEAKEYLKEEITLRTAWNIANLEFEDSLDLEFKRDNPSQYQDNIAEINQKIDADIEFLETNYPETVPAQEQPKAKYASFDTVIKNAKEAMHSQPKEEKEMAKGKDDMELA